MMIQLCKLAVYFLMGSTLAGFAHADDHRMVQAEKAFLGNIDDQALKILGENDSIAAIKEKTTKEFTIKKGDRIIFINKDIVLHNIYSDFFDLKGQQIGDSVPVKFDKSGDYNVKCHIHPKMEMTVHVTDK